MDDRDLIRRSVRGDEAAFELIVRRHTDAVWRVARAMLRDDHAAEDAVQETFLKAFRGLASFRGDASPKTWLVSICRRECIDRIRAKTEAPISLDRVREQHARHERPDLKVALDQALARLDEREREAFTLVDVLGYSREEAAQITGVKSSTMRSRVARARERMAELISPQREAADGR